MPAHGSSHHGWRIITNNAGSRQLTPRVENNSQTMPAHGSSHHGWRIITDNAGSRQLSPLVENNSHTMPAHGSSHHSQNRLTAIHTKGGKSLTHNAGSRQLTPRVENYSHTMPAHGSSHHGWRIIHTQCRLTAVHTTGGELFTNNAGSRQFTPRVRTIFTCFRISLYDRSLTCLGYVQYYSATGLTYPWNLYVSKHDTRNVHAMVVIPSITLCHFLCSLSHRQTT